MACRSGPRPARLRYVVSGLRQLAATRDVALARPHDHGLVLDEVVDRDGALLDLRERGRARVLDEPCRAADGRRAVLPPRAERARAVTPQLARLRLLRGRVRAPAGERLDQPQLGHRAWLGDLEDPVVERRRLRLAALLGHRRQRDLALPDVDRRAERDALRSVELG